jgi:hypothetical protein
MATRLKRHSSTRPRISVAGGKLIPRSRSARKATFGAAVLLAGVAAATQMAARCEVRNVGFAARLRESAAAQ